MRYRGPVLIHAAKRADDVSLEDIERRFGVRLDGDLPFGGLVVGIAQIIDCVRPNGSRWYANAHYADGPSAEQDFASEEIPFRAVAQMVGFGRRMSKIHYLSMGVD